MFGIEEEEEDFDFLDDLEDEEEDETEDQPENGNNSKGILSNLFTTSIDANYVPLRLEKRPARLDITKNSKEDHRKVERCTKKEAEDQLKKDYHYMKGKGYMMVQPFIIMDDYFYKKSKSDSDIIRDDKKNVDYDLILVLGRLPKLKGTEEFKGKPYLRGEIMYVKAGQYDIGYLKPHFALVLKKKYKVIKKSKVRKLFDPVKNELQNGKPFIVYKEFPRLIEAK